MGRSSEAGRWNQIGERLVAALGLLLLLGVLGALTIEALQPSSPPAIVVEVDAITRSARGFLVEFRATNEGADTAAAVLVEGTLAPTDDPEGEPVESAEATLDFVPGKSERRGGLFFTQDPAGFALELTVKGYAEP